jgi:hypothetical protein
MTRENKNKSNQISLYITTLFLLFFSNLSLFKKKKNHEPYKTSISLKARFEWLEEAILDVFKGHGRKATVFLRKDQP